MSIENVLQCVKKDMDRVEKNLFAYLSDEIEVIRSVGSYVLGSGGKRFRPLILLLSARFCNYKGDKHIPLACVLEYIHTATLLHDDVVDHAQVRRGNSSANILWGDQTTVLVGDFLLSKAFSMTVDLGNLRILEIISKTATLMAEAETFQISRTNDPSISEEEYFLIITKKTASLIAAASQIGAILGESEAAQEKALEDYGLNLGIAFQIMDDVLDYTSTENDLGKTIGKDLQEGSITLPFIEALKRSSPEDRRIMMETVENGPLKERDLALIIQLIEKYQGGQYAIERAKKYIQMARRSLAIFGNDGKGLPLLALADYVGERKC